MSKNILILAFILFPLLSYCEIPNILDNLMEVNVKIGYDENHFSPLKPQESYEGLFGKYAKFKENSLKLDKVKPNNKVEEEKEKKFAKMVLLSFAKAVGIYIFTTFILFVILKFLGCSLLITAKIIQVSRKKP